MALEDSPERIAFAYATLQHKYHDPLISVESNIETFMEGDDQAGNNRLMNSNKGNVR